MGEDWGKLIVAKSFRNLPKVQNIANLVTLGAFKIEKMMKE